MSKHELHAITPTQTAAIQEFLKRRWISHAAVNDAFAKVKANIHVGIPITLVVGPTRAGKSMLKERITKEICIYAKEDPDFSASRVAVISATILANPRSFSWKPLFIDLMRGGGEPAIDKKVAYRIEETAKGPKIHISSSLHTDEMQQMAINVLQYRAPYVVLIDEIHDILRVGREDSFKKQVDVLKSISEHGKVPLVLFGTHDFLNIFDSAYSAQLSQRKEIVELRRYKSSKDDQTEYKKILISLQSEMPLAPDFPLADELRPFQRNKLPIYTRDNLDKPFAETR